MAFGSLGGLVAQLLQTDGRFRPLRALRTATDFGSWAFVAVGAVGALVAIGISPPGGDWIRFWGAAVWAGVGARSLFVAAANGKRASELAGARDAAESKARNAEERALTVKRVATQELQAALRLSQEGREGPAVTKRTMRAKTLTLDGGGSASIAGGSAAEASATTGEGSVGPDVILHLARALQTIDAVGVAGDTRERMRRILQDVFGRPDVEPGKLADFGMGDDERDDIVFQTNQEWANLTREFDRSDVQDSDSLRSLTRKVDDLLL